MFNEIHYVPILKAKEGEFRALQDSFEDTKDRMTPLLEITDIPWDFEKEKESKTIDDHLSKLGKKIVTVWGDMRRLFVDSSFIDGSRLMNDDTTHYLSALFSDFRDLGLQAVPVTGLDRHYGYKRAVKEINNTDRHGICLRLLGTELGNADLAETIVANLELYELAPNDVDLILDLGNISGVSTDLLKLTISTIINNSIPRIAEWRSFTVASSGFPVDLSEISANTMDTIRRTDWLLWQSLQGTPISRMPSFGDYAISHPDIIELDPRNITVSASIRYTCDEYWLILRGRSLKRFGHDQFRNLCSHLINRPEYTGRDFSWGDAYINDCANGIVGNGNLTTWRRVGCNHHFQKVVTQIANLF